MCDSSDEETKTKKVGSAPPSRQGSQASIDSSCSSFEKIDPIEQTEEMDTQLFANTLPPIVFLGNQIVDTPDPDPRDVPIKPSQEQYYTAETMRAALGNLVFFSVAMFTAPFIAMYLSYHYLFLDYFGLARSDAMLDAGMVGVGTVFFIMAGFCYVAYREEVEAEKEKIAREGERRVRDEEGEKRWGQEAEEMDREEEEERQKEREAAGGGGDAHPIVDDESKKDK